MKLSQNRIEEKVESNEKFRISRKGKPSKDYFLLNDALLNKCEIKKNDKVFMDINEFLTLYKNIEKIYTHLSQIIKNNNIYLD